jgi:hypothetical protein
MRNPRADFESQILELAKRTTGEYQERLAAAQVSLSPPSLQRRDSDEELTELEVWVYEDAKVRSCIEFFIWKGGQPYLSVEETRRWLVAELENLLQAEPSGKAGSLEE